MSQLFEYLNFLNLNRSNVSLKHMYVKKIEFTMVVEQHNAVNYLNLMINNNKFPFENMNHFRINSGFQDS